MATSSTFVSTFNGLNLIPFSHIAIRLDGRDPVAIAKEDILPGVVISADLPGLPFEQLTITQKIPAGHKFALCTIVAGEEILRYGCRIGIASMAMAAGDWVHTHNLEVGDLARNFAIRTVAASGDAPAAATPEHTFMGYPRPRGLNGTRNYILVVSTVNCSAQTARAIAQAFPPELLSAYPNVDGVLAITHSTGCSIPAGSLAHEYLQRTLLNLIGHPNVGGIIFVGLGCEVNQLANQVEERRIAQSADEPGACQVGPYLTLQQQGGIEATIKAGRQAVREMLPYVNRAQRVPVPLSSLKVALQCGGSDSWSGVTANPLIGKVADQIVAAGGTVVLSETPEIYGAEYLLTSRAASLSVGQKLVDCIKEWQAQAELLGVSLDNNPSPGNKAGGLTTIFEKSLGAVSKGGSSPLRQVYQYAETVDSPGLVFMDTPGNDPVSVTGQVAGGCSLVLFSTGRGSVFGGSIAPCLKVASNTSMYRHMAGDMDYNAGALLDGISMEEAAADLLGLVIQAASGAPTRAERIGYREAEFVPWQPGIVL
jgi:altronate hydrolase